jgi:DNA-binding SARP family transcriptional activator
VPAVLRCLGGFQLQLAGRQLDWERLRPRARAMLRLLALHAGRPVHREQLAVALWPDRPAAAATHGVQVAISALRRFLEPDAPRRSSRWLVRDGDVYVFVVPAGSWSDLGEFAAARRHWRELRGLAPGQVEAVPLRRALAVYGGDLLPEDGAAEWVVGERERLRLEAAELATVLGALELKLGQPADAVGTLARALKIDPFRDTPWRLLADAYQAVGDVAAAAQARRDYARLLTELDVPGRPRPPQAERPVTAW